MRLSFLISKLRIICLTWSISELMCANFLCGSLRLTHAKALTSLDELSWLNKSLQRVIVIRELQLCTTSCGAPKSLHLSCSCVMPGDSAWVTFCPHRMLLSGQTSYTQRCSKWEIIRAELSASPQWMLTLVTHGLQISTKRKLLDSIHVSLWVFVSVFRARHAPEMTGKTRVASKCRGYFLKSTTLKNRIHSKTFCRLSMVLKITLSTGKETRAGRLESLCSIF